MKRRIIGRDDRRNISTMILGDFHSEPQEELILAAQVHLFMEGQFWWLATAFMVVAIGDGIETLISIMLKTATQTEDTVITGAELWPMLGGLNTAANIMTLLWSLLDKSTTTLCPLATGTLCLRPLCILMATQMTNQESACVWNIRYY